MSEPRYKEFYEYLEKRELVRLNKAASLPKPWTDDVILQNYKFTNVRREHDRTSLELCKIYDKHQDADPVDILMNCAVARYFGTYEFMNAVRWRDKFKLATLEQIKSIANTRLTLGQRVFTGAYVITNQGISRPKEEVVCDYFLRPLLVLAPKLVEWAKKKGDWHGMVRSMGLVPGFGGTGFMAKEITLDTMYFKDFWQDKRSPHLDRVGSQPTDYWNWTPMGPGARRGLARVLGKDLKKPDQMVHAVRLIQNHQTSYWPLEWGKLSPTDIQFGLCEFSKYEKVRLEEGRPRSRYDGKGS